jgi:hypothetical protein
MLMPPKGKRLSAAQVETLSRWIQEGALWPEGVDSVSLNDPNNGVKKRLPQNRGVVSRSR